MVVTSFWFSSTKIVEAISIVGKSFTDSIVTVTSALAVLSPWVIV